MRPNFLWITTDHQLYMPHMKVNPVFRLKNYERICDEGTRFTSDYCPMPICAPSRSSMITGLYPHKHGFIGNGTAPECAKELDDSLPFFNKYMKEEGYRTAWFGKWHCGTTSVAADKGFEGFTVPGYGSLYTTAEYKEYLERKGLTYPQVEIEWSAKLLPVVGKTITCGLSGGNDDLGSSWGPFETTGHMLTPKEGHEAYFLADKVCDWLEKNGSDSPFVMKLEFWGPHHPYHVAAPFYGSIDPDEIELSPSFHQILDETMPDTYRSSVRRWAFLQNNHTSEKKWKQILARAYEHSMMIDDAYGKVLDKLDELGLKDNTVVIFTSDHGDSLSSHSGLFNKDSIMTEETVNVPLAMCGPGIEKGFTDDRPCTGLDIVPTIFQLAGICPPDEWDGSSLLGERREQVMVEEYGEVAVNQFQRLLVRSDMRYIAHLNEVDEYYDLSVDPYQTRNMLFDEDQKDRIVLCRKELISEMEKYCDDSHWSQELIRQITEKMSGADEYAFCLPTRDRYMWM